jgi:hypothetical protein
MRLHSASCRASSAGSLRRQIVSRSTSAFQKRTRARTLQFPAAAYIIACATDVSIAFISDRAAASRGVYSRLIALYVIFSGLQENACWSITKEHPKKTKSVEKDRRTATASK